MSDIELKTVPTSSLVVDPNQPRREFGAESELKKNKIPLEALASSIKDLGILQPILARPHGRNKYMIIAGERRWRAAQIAGLAEVQIIVRSGLTGMNLELAQLAENLQREDLTDLDVANSIGDMMGRYPELRKKDLAKLINRSPSYITRMLAMIDPEWKSLVLSGVVTYASVLEAFKGKSQAVRDLAMSSSKASGKPITHDALRAAEQQLLRVENSVAVQPELYDKLMADMGFGPGPTPGLSLAMDASAARTTSSLASTRIRGGNANDSQSSPSSSAYGEQAKMGWDAYQALLKVLQPAAKPALVELNLTGAEIKAALDRMGIPCPNDEFERLPALMRALRAGAPAKTKRK